MTSTAQNNRKVFEEQNAFQTYVINVFRKLFAHIRALVIWVISEKLRRRNFQTSYRVPPGNVIDKLLNKEIQIYAPFDLKKGSLKNVNLTQDIVIIFVKYSL